MVGDALSSRDSKVLDLHTRQTRPPIPPVRPRFIPQGGQNRPAQPFVPQQLPVQPPRPQYPNFVFR